MSFVSQLDEKSEQYTTTKLNLEEKRAQCTDAELRARDIEDHYLNKTQLDHQREVSQLRVIIETYVSYKTSVNLWLISYLALVDSHF